MLKPLHQDWRQLVEIEGRVSSRLSSNSFARDVIETVWLQVLADTIGAIEHEVLSQPVEDTEDATIRLLIARRLSGYGFQADAGQASNQATAFFEGTTA